jgi:hypothetical protein
MAWMVLARVVRWRDAEAETPQPNHDVDEPHEPGTAPIANRHESSSPTRVPTSWFVLGPPLDLQQNGRFTSLSRHTLVILVSRASLHWSTISPTWSRCRSKTGSIEQFLIVSVELCHHLKEE